jgi:hypothetical protein
MQKIKLKEEGSISAEKSKKTHSLLALLYKSTTSAVEYMLASGNVTRGLNRIANMSFVRTLDMESKIPKKSLLSNLHRGPQPTGSY